MPNEKLNHDANRRKVCAPCGKKTVFEIKMKEYFVLYSRYFSLVKEFVKTNYSMVDKKFPIGLCTTCHFKMYDYETDIFKLIVACFKVSKKKIFRIGFRPLAPSPSPTAKKNDKNGLFWVNFF